MKHDIGLRGYWTNKGDQRTFWYKLKGYGWELTKAFQRFWRGYSDDEIFGFDGALIERFKVLLPEFYEMHHKYINAPKTDEAVLKMISLLKYYDELVCQEEVTPEKHKAFEDQFNGVPIPEHLKLTTEDFKACFKLQKDKTNEFFELFSEYFMTLWF